MKIIHGDCLEVLPTLADASVDAVITDPPYPEIDRAYGRWTEAEWWDLMMGVCKEVRRILKPTGSAVFILQPNSRKVGSMRGWLWEFMAWACREWNMVQDAWGWNPAAPPTVHVNRGNGLMRPSVTAFVWLGDPDCYRNQDAVLWEEAQASRARYACARVGLAYTPSGHHTDFTRTGATAIERGGVTPFNMVPWANTDSKQSGGANGHGAAKPVELCQWWTRYICPPGGTVLDPFLGSGTTALACLAEGRECIGIERDESYVAIARARLAEARGPLFAGLYDDVSTV